MEETPAYSVIISDRARHMLGVHIRFLANVSPSAARKTKAELLRAIRSLAVLPGRFPFFDAQFIPPNKYHKMLVEKQYLVLYQVKDTVVYVDYILDCRQDYGWFVN